MNDLEKELIHVYESYEQTCQENIKLISLLRRLHKCWFEDVRSWVRIDYMKTINQEHPLVHMEAIIRKIEEI